MLSNARNIFVGLATFALLTGCQPTQQGQQPDPLSSGPLNTNVQTVSPETAVRADACAEQLHNIGGALLFYYATNHQMPAQLEELKPFADFDQAIELKCPKSGKPYAYAPNGLGAAGKDKRIVVYDSEPSHDGKRWCLFMVPAGPGHALAVEVLEVPEGLFRTFTP